MCTIVVDLARNGIDQDISTMRFMTEENLSDHG
jgi:hypothetical protein